jgi:hypothetical protein
LLRVGAIGGAGMLIALPQVVATARVVAFSVRAASRPQAAEVLTFVFHPLRSLELVIPFPFGWPAHALPYGLWGGDWLGGVPYYLSVYQGLVALWLAAVATFSVRRHLRWALLALAGLLVAAFGGAAGELLVRLAGGLFRYPEKFLFWFALAMPLLAGWGLQHVLEERPLLRGGAGRSALWARAALWAGAVLAGSGALLLALRGRAVARIDALNPADPEPGTILAVQAALWGASLLLGGTLLALAATAGRRGGRRAALGVLACQALCLLQLAPIVLVDSTARFKVTSDGLAAHRGGQWMGGLSLPRWTAMNGYWADVVPWRPMHLAPHATLAPAVGLFHDHGYPLATNAEGLGSVLKYELQKALQLAGWPERVNWLRVLGIERVAFGAPAEPVPGLRLVATIAHGEDRYYHYAVDDPAPEVRWPRHLIPVHDLDLAMLAVGKSPDPLATAALPAALGELDHDPAGRVRLIASEPDRLLFEVEGGGGVAVVRRAFHPLLHARIEGGALDGRTLPLFYADVFLTGVQVPPGHHRVVLEAAGAGPEIAAGLLALAVAAGCAWVARPRRWGRQQGRA